MAIDFRSSARPTLGVEWEFALVDKSTRDLVNAASELLDLVADSKRPLRFVDIAERSGLAKGTVHRMLAALVEARLLHVLRERVEHAARKSAARAGSSSRTALTLFH